MKPYYVTKERDFILYQGDARCLLQKDEIGKFDMVFADPPYFLSNDGLSVQGGKRVSVNKGAWDKSQGLDADRRFTYDWLKGCRKVMKESATIWVCGTFHNIFAVASVLTELDFRILNSVVWQKTNPPPNLSCRMFTHSTEFLVWARKSKKVSHCFNYDLVHRLAGDRQMTDVWRLPAIGRWEKECGKHPTQKPLALVCRAILASTKSGATILDPFAGSSTTGIAANLLGRRFVGVEIESGFLNLSVRRRQVLPENKRAWQAKIPDVGLVGQGT